MTDHSSEPELTSSELADLERFSALARDLEATDLELEEPPAALWAGIEAGLAGATATSVAEPEVSEPTAAQPAIDVTDTSTPDTATPDTAAPHTSTPDNVIQGPWGKAAPLLLGAIAAVSLLVLGAFAFNQANSGDTIAEVALQFTEGPGFDPLGSASTGNAAIIDDGGDQCLDLELSALPAVDDAYLEVWLIDTNVEGMVSLGPIEGDGCVSIPASVDPGAFPVVDISIEPTDGQPAHSGRSILRGVLDI